MFFRMSAGPQRIPEFTHIHAGRLELITRDVVVAGIAFWIVLLAVIALHIFTSRRGSS